MFRCCGYTVSITMIDIYSIDSIVATRRGIVISTFRGLKPTAKFIWPLRGRRTAEIII